MKLLKSIATVSALATVLSQSAFAGSDGLPHIYITGSSAFRSAALVAIENALVLGGTAGPNGNGTWLTSHGSANDSSVTGTGNTSFIWEGATLGGNAVTVEANFTGSEAGTAAVANSASQIPFLPDNVTGTTNPSAYSDVAGTTAQAGYPTATPDIAFSDVGQGTTPFNGFLSKTGITYTACTDSKVGLLTFKWVASKGFPKTANAGTAQSTASTTGGTSSISIEPQFISQLYSAGQSWLNCLTGNTYDADTELYASGRNPDSGTRATALADSGYGVSIAVKQYQVTASGGAASAIALFPVSTVAGLSTGTPGNSGEASGANLRAYAGDTFNASSLSVTGNQPDNMYFIIYLGLSDAATAEGLGGVELAYKGVNYSNAAIYNGQYTYWSFEHLLARPGQSGNPLALYNSLVSLLTANPTSQVAAIKSAIAGVGFNLNDPNLWFTRSGDGLSLKASQTFTNILQSNGYPF